MKLITVVTVRILSKLLSTIRHLSLALFDDLEGEYLGHSPYIVSSVEGCQVTCLQSITAITILPRPVSESFAPIPCGFVQDRIG
jgi:hypothetical protein